MPPLVNTNQDKAVLKLHGVDVTKPDPAGAPVRAQQPRCARCAGKTYAEPVAGDLWCWHCRRCGWEGAWFRYARRAPAAAREVD